MYLALVCSTPSGAGPWNFVTPGSTGAHDHLVGDRRLASYVHDRQFANGAPVPRAWDLTHDAGNFSRPAFDASLFTVPRHDPIIRGDMHTPLASLARLEFCPDIPAMQDRECRACYGRICGGPEFEAGGQLRQRAWFVRYDRRMDQ